MIGKSFVPSATRPDDRIAPHCQARGHCIHQAAAADAPGLHVSDHGGAHLAMIERDARDGARGRSHSHADRAGFKGRSRRRGGADNPSRLPMAISPFVPRSTKASRSSAARDAGGKNSGKNVRSHKTAQATLKANAAGRWQRPIQFVRPETLRAQMGRMERRMRKRLNIQPAKQVMHYRVADQNNFDNLLFAAVRQLGDHLPQSKAHDRGQIGSLQNRVNPAHHIRPERCLGIESGLDAAKLCLVAKSIICAAIVVVPRSMAIPRPDLPAPEKDGVVREHIHAPLAALKNQRRLRTRLAGETPSIGKFACRENRTVRFGNRKRSFEYADAASTAESCSAAWKLNARSASADAGARLRAELPPLPTMAPVEPALLLPLISLP